MNRNPEVDQWLDAADGPVAEMMRRARDLILGADGRVTESIKWKTPTFAYRGNIASFNPSKHLLSIMFHRGAEIPGGHPRLEGDGKRWSLAGAEAILALRSLKKSHDHDRRDSWRFRARQVRARLYARQPQSKPTAQLRRVA